MTFDKVLEDINKLVGLRLNSIRQGAEITIQELSIKDRRIILKTSNGQEKTRSIDELERIWKRLCTSPAIHVDEVLHGSGSSRNQPETIFANLPYIEWFRYNNKKHIVYVGNPTHVFGTIKQMDAVKADEIKQRMSDVPVRDTSLVLVVTNDIASACKAIEQATGIPVEPVLPGIYVHNNNDFRYMIVLNSLVPPTIMPGTYPVMNNIYIPKDNIQFNVGDLRLNAIAIAGMHIMVCIK